MIPQGYLSQGLLCETHLSVVQVLETSEFKRKVIPSMIYFLALALVFLFFFRIRVSVLFDLLVCLLNELLFNGFYFTNFTLTLVKEKAKALLNKLVMILDIEKS